MVLKMLFVLLLSGSYIFANSFEVYTKINICKNGFTEYALRSTIELEPSQPVKILTTKDLAVEVMVSAKENSVISVQYSISKKNSNDDWEIAYKPVLLLKEDNSGAIDITNPDKAIHIKAKAREIFPR